MSADTWIEDNHRYLAASLNWLRLRLQQMAPANAPQAAAAPPPAPAAVVVVPSPPPAPAQRSWFAQKTAAPLPTSLSAPAAAPATIAMPQQLTPPSEFDALARAAGERDAATQVDPPPALVMLERGFRLSAFERDTLLLCAAAELDPGMGALFAAAQGNPTRTYPSFALALHAFEQPTWDAMSPQHPLRRERLVEVSASAATALTSSPLRADERIVNYLKGLNALDERLATLMTAPSGATPDELSESQQDVADAVLARLHSVPADGAVPAIQLLGTDPASKQAVARAVCSAIGRPQLYRITVEALPTQRNEIETLARLWQRESVLLPVALHVDADALDGSASEASAALQAFISREPGLLFVGLREAPPGGGQLAFEVDKPTVAEQGLAWQKALASGSPADAPRSAQLLAGQFDLNLEDIRRAAAEAESTSGDASLFDKAWDASRALARPRLDALAQRLEPKATWDDLVLSDESSKLLRQIATQVHGRFRVYEDWGYAKKMTRGLGISALFAGESGTGKTMAAEVIANELRLHLYRIDLSAVVSKYIGETEKNLRRLFDAAELGGAILFFDEADALFGKRSEVKDSHDRYANIEINYLLQRMEAFSGLAILASNMKSALDPAFLRRLRFIVNFPFPGPLQRREMWRKAFPADVPQEGLDFEKLARFNLSGGNIHSIALNAAFAAAHRESAVTQPLLLSAVRAELRKLDKPVNEAEFR